MAQLQRLQQLLGILNDQKFHSGEVLGQALDVSRAVIWKDIKQLEQMGLQLQRVKGRGYRLPQPLQLLNQQQIAEYLKEDAQDLEIDVAFATESTNQDLMQRSRADQDLSGVARIAEYQYDGRGRRGKSWQSPPCSNLMFSLLWRFELPPARLGLLSLVVGVAIGMALEESLQSNIQLKWPNDLLFDGRKLAGILVELPKISEDQTTAVIGIGINLADNQQLAEKIDQPWISLAEIADEPIDRNRLQARLLQRLVDILKEPERWPGLIGSFWKDRDWLHGKRVDIRAADRLETGLALGINEAGGLMVATEKGEKAVYAGEVSVRRAK